MEECTPLAQSPRMWGLHRWSCFRFGWGKKADVASGFTVGKISPFKLCCRATGYPLRVELHPSLLHTLGKVFHLFPKEIPR